MQQGVGSVTFSGAARAGSRRLSPHGLYRASAARGGRVSITGPGLSTTLAAPLVATPAGGALRLMGPAENGRRDGRYRGSLELRPSGGGLEAIDAVGHDDYARGVVAVESDPSWPLAELEAQAVATRTYAITDTGHPGFDVYADTRSQLYAGVGGETPSTDRAVGLTAGQVVTYQGRPVITFFFDTSGGRTESIENAFAGSPPAPWLVSVDDPYDTLSPRAEPVARRERVVGVVAAVVVGSAGTVKVSGSQLEARLGLPDTWACFAMTGASGRPPAGWDAPCMTTLSPGSTPAPSPPGTRPPSSPTGGAGAPSA
jgi:stage II sporulation protein D